MEETEDLQSQESSSEIIEAVADLELPEDKQKKVVALIKKTTSITRHSGPLPSPESLAKYNQIDSSLVDRIVSMAEKQQEMADSQQKHEQNMDKDYLGLNKDNLTESVSLAKKGQLMAFVLAFLFGGIGLWLALAGHSVVAGFVFTTTIGALTTVFILRKPAKSSSPPEE